MSQDVKYPEIEVDLTAVDGNAFSLIGTVDRALKRGKVPREEIEAFKKEAMSGDYDNVIQTCMKWVNVF